MDSGDASTVAGRCARGNCVLVALVAQPPANSAEAERMRYLKALNRRPLTP